MHGRGLQAEDGEAELKRLQRERIELRERMSESRARNREMTSVMNDLQLCLYDLQSKVRDRRQRKSMFYLCSFGVGNYMIGSVSLCLFADGLRKGYFTTDSLFSFSLKKFLSKILKVGVGLLKS